MHFFLGGVLIVLGLKFLSDLQSLLSITMIYTIQFYNIRVPQYLNDTLCTYRIELQYLPIKTTLTTCQNYSIYL